MKQIQPIVNGVLNEALTDGNLGYFFNGSLSVWAVITRLFEYTSALDGVNPIDVAECVLLWLEGHPDVAYQWRWDSCLKLRVWTLAIDKVAGVFLFTKGEERKVS